ETRRPRDRSACTSTGKKHALAIRDGSTENATLCRSLLGDLVARGPPPDRSTLVVIDGGTGLRSGVKSVFGDYALVQHCHSEINIDRDDLGVFAAFDMREEDDARTRVNTDTGDRRSRARSRR
ncbi:MAG TPA: hypothetical protein VIV58_00415, partial [Kofleriaceae bacterium]